MPDSQLDLSNFNHWELLWSFRQDVEFIAPERYLPLPRYIVPIQVNKAYLGVWATSESAAPHWRSAGFLSQQIPMGFFTGANFDTQATDSKRVLLNQAQLLTFPRYTNSYALTFQGHRWLRDITLTLWKYIGPESNSIEEAIELTRIDILRTEQKINLLFQDLQ